MLYRVDNYQFGICEPWNRFLLHHPRQRFQGYPILSARSSNRDSQHIPFPTFINMDDSPSLKPRRAYTFDSQRRNSTLSDSISEARNSIRSSTDDLFLPRVAKDHATLSTEEEESHWHSAPLGLALLPAIAGIFFHEGSSFVTDVTLLVLAAIFLNWSVRLPWYVPLYPPITPNDLPK